MKLHPFRIPCGAALLALALLPQGERIKFYLGQFPQ
jgi:hypothetical protein